MRLIKKVGDWFDARLQLAAPIRETMEHPVPRQTASWAYVFGSAALTVFMLQLVTGILLALLYVPSAAEAWNSLQILNHQVALGWFIRALHGWGSNFMVAIVLIHMVQVFLFGAYKFPRELTWIVGILLLLLTLGMAFTGQVLRFDQDAYWGLGIGASISSRVPVLGPWIVKLLLGGPIIAGATLSRFFALHVFVIPGSLIAFVGLHLLLVLKLGINEWPMPGRIVRRATYMKEYHELTHKDGIPFVPGAMAKDLFFSGFILLCDRRVRRVFRPLRTERTAGSHDYPDRAAAGLLFPVALCRAVPASAFDGNSGVADRTGDRAGVLLALPFFSGEGEKSWRRRPIAVLTILLVAVALGTFTHLAGYAPWSPVMDAWSGDPIPAQYLKGRTALERQGRWFFRRSSATTATRWAAWEGSAGRQLDRVAVELTQDQLIRQVIQGGGNMPAYGKNLSPAETTALVAFLETLHPAGQSPARDASRAVVSGRALVGPNVISTMANPGHGAADCGGAGLLAGLVSASE